MPNRMISLGFPLLLLACQPSDTGPLCDSGTIPVPDPDADGDGYDEDDCNDNDATVYPGATEVCDGRDNDCDGERDEDDAEDAATWYTDSDGDGFGDPGSTTVACQQPDGAVDDDEDCDDGDAAVNPDAEEVCDGIDNDCDGELDNDAADATTWYLDEDGDGYGLEDDSILACEQPKGWAPKPGDCDDQAPTAYPGAAEVCDGIDNDCDDVTDPDASDDATTWYRDSDGDGYGNTEMSWTSCEAPTGYVETPGDCDDTDEAFNSDAEEICDELDNDCDGLTDDEDKGVAGGETWYADADGDGFGDSASTTTACLEPSGYTADATDCDDTNSDAYPEAAEVCDEVDNNCDGLTDDDDPTVSDARTWYPDTDGDGFGDGASGLSACIQPSGYIADSDDCDDTDYDVNPDATEVCDDIDNDCDDMIDIDDPSIRGDVDWYADSDGDGFGDRASSLTSCTQPTGYTSDSDDCDDTDYDVNPDATEICGDGVDNDCDGTAGACWEGSHSLGGADVKIAGESSGDYAGRRIAFGGDINGDGVDDLLVGASGADADSGTAADAGKAYVLFGPVTADGDLSGAGLIMTGVNASDCAGDGLSSAGDTDGDGYDDLLVGAYQADSGGSDSGTVFLVMGPASGGSMVLDTATTAFLGDAAGDYMGYAVAGDGDMNGDGYDDLLIGAYGADPSGASSGLVYVIHGPASSGRIDASAAGYTLVGESNADYAGYAVALTGDTDGDGYHDLLVGAYGDDDGGSAAGAAYLVLGPAEWSGALADSDAKLLGESTGVYAGSWTSAAGDVNADGYADIMVGAPYADAGTGTNTGVTYLLHGPISSGSSSLSIAQSFFVGESGADYVGEQFSSAGDVDGDGGDDILVGTSYDDEGGSNAGCAYLVFGPTSGAISLADAHVKLTGESASDGAGAVARAGDQNLDGYDDLLIGAPRDDDSGSDAGALYVVFGDVGI